MRILVLLTLPLLCNLAIAEEKIERPELVNVCNAPLAANLPDNPVKPVFPYRAFL